MRLFCFAFLITIFTMPGFAQKKARDFKVTTTDRRQIELYRDYLNKGRVVMLKIMFVDCPPCNDIAPQISDLYRKYGSGDSKVEFIELSNKSWDADQAMIGYKLKYNLPFPSASNDGGSVQAADLYSDNYFGPFYGTPTFVVIKPDGTLNFDPRGNNKNETITLLDSALARAMRIIPTPVDTSKPVTPPVDTTKPATPPTDTTKPATPPTDTMKPATPPTDTSKPKPITIDTIKLSGNLSATGGGLGLVNMTLNWNGKDIKFATDLFGNFVLNLLDTSKTKGSGTFKVEYSLAYNAGLSAIDLVLIQKHILSVQPFTKYQQLLAADVNNDNDINVLDLLELRKLILGITEKLPNNTPSQYFLFQNPNNLIKSFITPLSYEELKSLSSKPIHIQVVKTGSVR